MFSVSETEIYFSYYRTARPLFNVRRKIWVIVDDAPNLAVGEQQFVHLKFALNFCRRRANRNEYLVHLFCGYKNNHNNYTLILLNKLNIKIIINIYMQMLEGLQRHRSFNALHARLR